MAYLSNIPLEEAQRLYLSELYKAGLQPRTERIPVRESLGRVTAQAVYARCSAPPYCACAMDGIALKAQLTNGASPEAPLLLRQEQYIPVDTGDPLPDGCDAVVMIEDCIPAAEGLLLQGAAAPWQHVRQIGEDISAGDMLLPSFVSVDAAAIGALLAGGVTELWVTARPRVAILPTGDELTEPGEHIQTGEVPEFNSAIFAALIKDWGGEAMVLPFVPDDKSRIRAALKEALPQSELVLIGAGTSAGRDDNTAAIIEEAGTLVCHGVAIRPGKPVALGRVGAKAVVGVPGYPVSGIVVLEQLVKPVVDALLGRESAEAELVPVRLSRRLTSSLKYREFIRASLGYASDGTLTATPLERGAGVVSSFVKADCLIDLPQNSEGAEQGAFVSARLLRSPWRIRNTVRIVGSHDPLLSEAMDLLRRRDPRYYVSSSHVGSLGGIFAVSEGEAALGGVHLLDETTGVYNESYIERCCPQGGVSLIGLVQRAQGLMVAKGNPLRIKDLFDVIEGSLRYVNRQRGAGTRVLLDHLLKQAGVCGEALNGYAREELTHTAVAAAVAAGSADCGLGIWSAARMYDLDFIPICEEQYDLLASTEQLERESVAAFMETLRSKAFAERVEALGGYRLDHAGELRRRF